MTEATQAHNQAHNQVHSPLLSHLPNPDFLSV